MATPKSPPRSAMAAMAAMGGALEGDGETVGRGRATSVGRSVGRSDHGKIHSNYTQHATRTMPLRKTVEATDFTLRAGIQLFCH